VIRRDAALRSLAAGPLAERQFRLLFSGQALSVIGDGIAPIAIAFAVLDLTGSPTDLGLVLTAGYLPLVAFLLIGGVWADRLPRRAVMLTADLVRAGTQATMGALLMSGAARLWQLVVLQVVYGIAAAFFRPAATGLVPAVVSPRRLQSANALLGMSLSLGFTVGPALGGVLVGALGTGTAFLVDAGTFVWSVVFLARMRPRAVTPAPPQHFLRDLADGFQEVRSRTWLWVSIAVASLAVMVEAGPTQVLGPVVAKAHLGGAAAWAALETGLGAGTLLGGASALRLRPRRPLLFGTASFVMAAPANILLGLVAPLPVLVAAQVCSGWAVGIWLALWDTLLQQRIPASALSRVSAYDWMGSLVLLPVGLALTAPVAAGIGISTTLIASGLIQLGLVGAALCVRDIRDLESARSPAPVAATESRGRN
jgi:predicted MFS family arabinose efflux permease